MCTQHHFESNNSHPNESHSQMNRASKKRKKERSKKGKKRKRERKRSKMEKEGYRKKDTHLVSPLKPRAPVEKLRQIKLASSGVRLTVDKGNII